MAHNLQLYLVDFLEYAEVVQYITAYMCDESALVLGWRPGNKAKAIVYEHRV